MLKAGSEESLAIHEAGHAVVASYYALPVLAVGCDPIHGWYCDHGFQPIDDPVALAVRRTVVAAGVVAERIVGLPGELIDHGHGSDAHQLQLLDERIGKLAPGWTPADPFVRAGEILRQPDRWSTTLALAASILRAGLLRGEDVYGGMARFALFQQRVNADIVQRGHAAAAERWVTW